MWNGDQIPIEDIFFVYLLNAQGITDRVIIFCHDTVTNTDELFSETQLEYFESENVDIQVSKQMIYKEDTVATIYEKIRRELDPELGTDDDMYLFTEDRRNITSLWNSVFTNSNTTTISYQIALQHSLAFGIDLGDHPRDKPFSSTEWSSLLLQNNQVRTLFVPLGYTSSLSIANPFNVSSSLLLSEENTPMLQQMDKHFLHFSTTSSNIYVCLKKKVTEYARNQGDLENLVSIYFPSRTKIVIIKDTQQETVDLVHQLSWYSPPSSSNDNHTNNYTKVCQLENVTLTWKLQHPQSIPLDAIFKRFHTSANVPQVTWFPSGSGEPIVRLYKPFAEAWTHQGERVQHSRLEFHLAEGEHQPGVFWVDSSARLTLKVPQAAKWNDLQFPEKVIKQINQILHSLSLSEIATEFISNASSIESLKPWQESCHFDYSLTIPSSMRFDNIPKDIPIFNTFHVTVTPRKLTLFEIPLLEYVSILDKYFNYVSQNHTTTTTREQTETSSSSFWLPPEPFAQEPDTDFDQDSVDLLQTHNNNNNNNHVTSSSPHFFQRTTTTTTPHGFQLLERPATSLSSSSSWKTLLGQGASDWHVAGAAGATTTMSGGMSFLQVMAMYYAHERNLESTPTDPEFRNALIQAMTLDRFLKYHNGNLPAFFRSSQKNPPQEDQVDVEPYEDSLFSKRLNLNDTHQMDLFRSVVASYETFLTHLQSNPIVEYAHIWDLVCDVNPDLMPRGLNLVLIRENGHQSQFVCPTNAYSSMALFDPDKPTAMILQQSDGTFLPLTRGDDQWTVKHVPQRIKELALHCRPTSSLSPDIYSFRPSITAADLQRIVVDDLNGAYRIVQQVASVQSTKIVALQIKGLDANQQTLYVPCLPSAYLDDIPQITSEKANATLLSYEVTRNRLHGLAYASRGKIPCKPMYKVVKEGMRLGLITEANEFVPTLHSSVQDGDGDDDLKVVEDAPPLSDTEWNSKTEEDPTTLALRLESQFYHLYQHLVNTLLDDTRKKMWQQQLHSVSISYQNKIQFLQKDIQSLVADHVHFQIIDASVVKDVNDMMLCSPENKDERYCLTTQQQQQQQVQTIFPKFNLVDATVNNETMYAMRLADELVRVRRKQLYFLHQEEEEGKVAATMTTVDYNLAEDEVVLSWSAFSSKESLKKVIGQRMTVWDTATPEWITASPVDRMDAVEFVQECTLTKKSRVSGFWRTCFARPVTQTTFRSTCTMAPLVFLAQKHRDMPMALASVRHVLWKAYASYFDPDVPEKYKEHTILLELLQAKDSEEIRNRILDETNYELNDVDWWVFCQNLQIPAFLIWKTESSSQTTTVPWIRLYSENAETTSYFFIQKHQKMVKGRVAAKSRYSIVNHKFTISELDTSALRDDMGRLVIQEI